MVCVISYQNTDFFILVSHSHNMHKSNLTGHQTGFVRLSHIIYFLHVNYYC